MHLFSVKFDSSKVKRNLTSQVTSCPTSQDLGCLEIKKSQNRLKPQENVKSSVQKLIFSNSDQNLRKNRHQSFIILFNFA